MEDLSNGRSWDGHEPSVVSAQCLLNAEKRTSNIPCPIWMLLPIICLVVLSQALGNSVILWARQYTIEPSGSPLRIPVALPLFLRAFSQPLSTKGGVVLWWVRSGVQYRFCRPWGNPLLEVVGPQVPLCTLLLYAIGHNFFFSSGFSDREWGESLISTGSEGP